MCPPPRARQAGPGPGTGLLHCQYLRGRRMVGIDPDPAVLNNCSLDESVIGAVDDLPFDEMSFDAAV